MRYDFLKLTLALGLIMPRLALAEPFTFVALGDMPYELPGDNVRFDRLIDAVNREAPVFTLHVGDTKSGSTSCGNAAYEKIRDDMNRFEAPLIYTPGDNEWRDCYKKKAGRFNSLERLNKLRDMFFSSTQSLGAQTMQVTRQADMMPEFPDYKENARFEYQGVMFVTAHLVSRNDKLEDRNPAATDEFFMREAANVAWIEASFAKARDDYASALVMAIHADLWREETDHETWVEAFLEHAIDFGKPILLIHGDSHDFLIDHPFEGGDDRVIEQLTRLQVYGAEQVQAVRVTVDTDDPAMFGFKPLIVPENIDDQSWD